MFFCTSDGAQMPTTSTSAAAAARRALPVASMTFSLPKTFGFRPPFASIGGGGGASTSAAAGGALLPHFGASQKEQATGIAFPGEVCVLSSRNCPQLAGVG